MPSDADGWTDGEGRRRRTSGAVSSWRLVKFYESLKRRVPVSVGCPADCEWWILFKQLAPPCNYHKSAGPSLGPSNSVTSRGIKGFLARPWASFSRGRFCVSIRRWPVSALPGNKFPELIRLLCGFQPSAMRSHKAARLMASVILPLGDGCSAYNGNSAFLIGRCLPDVKNGYRFNKSLDSSCMFAFLVSLIVEKIV